MGKSLIIICHRKMIKSKKQKTPKVIIIGAGPAGLSCAYELLNSTPKKDLELTVLDKNNQVGGLSRTEKFKGFLFDIGPHRFYTKNKEVLSLWQQVLGKDFISVNRLTRIFYENKFFLYPVEFIDVLKKLGIKDSVKSAISYIKAKLFLTSLKPKTFEEWITKNFGQKLYSIFFKTYTEKVWGIPCNQIGAEWASQRIKNLDFFQTLLTAVFGQKTNKTKTLINQFNYPLYGAGYFYQMLSNSVIQKGGGVLLSSTVTKIYHQNNKITAVEYIQHSKKTKISVDYLFASLPLTHFIQALNPKPNPEVLRLANQLYYRDHITVNLIINKAHLFSDSWIYIHSPKVQMARIANYSNFSKKMVKEQNHSAISVEYFVFQSDNLWKLSNQQLQELAIKELGKLNILNWDEVVDGFVVRETESYPTYYLGYQDALEKLKSYVEQFTNLQMIGRGGMYKYNNMDHSIYSGQLAAKNYLAGKKIYDLWAINEDAEYLETK